MEASERGQMHDLCIYCVSLIVLYLSLGLSCKMVHEYQESDFCPSTHALSSYTVPFRLSVTSSGAVVFLTAEHIPRPKFLVCGEVVGRAADSRPGAHLNDYL